MKQELAIKVYDIDYSFILKNYLDPQLWTKEWTLFVYKDVSFVIFLKSIDTRNRSIDFAVRSEHTINGNKDHDTATFSYNLGNSNIESLKRQIRGSMESLIGIMENYSIYSTKEYQKARDLEREHNSRLKDRAEQYLDSNGIYLSEVRDAYIDYYTNKMSYSYTQNVMSAMKYDLLFDVYMIFYKATGQMDKFEKLKDTYARKHYNEYQNVMEEIEEKLKYLETEEYEEELDSGLDSIM